jgi:hypothetical protein
MGQTTFEFGTETIEPEEPQVEHPKSEKKEAKKKVTNKKTKAHQLAKEQRDIPVSEFFEQNRHILGFDNPTHSLITAVKEGVGLSKPNMWRFCSKNSETGISRCSLANW